MKCAPFDFYLLTKYLVWYCEIPIETINWNFFNKFFA